MVSPTDERARSSGYPKTLFLPVELWAQDLYPAIIDKALGGSREGKGDSGGLVEPPPTPAATIFSHATEYTEKIQVASRMYHSLSQDSKTEFGLMIALNSPVLVMNWGSSVLFSNATLQDLTSRRTVREMNESERAPLLGCMNEGLIHCFADWLTDWLIT